MDDRITLERLLEEYQQAMREYRACQGEPLLVSSKARDKVNALWHKFLAARQKYHDAKMLEASEGNQRNTPYARRDSIYIPSDVPIRKVFRNAWQRPSKVVRDAGKFPSRAVRNVGRFDKTSADVVDW